MLDQTLLMLRTIAVHRFILEVPPRARSGAVQRRSRPQT
jgi:hypothetical protein